MPDPVAIREQIMAAIEARLASIDLDGLSVERNRDEEVSRFPSLIVLDGDQEPDHGSHGVTIYDLQVAIEGHVRAGTAAQLGGAATALYAAAIHALCLDPSLGGLAIDLAEGAMSTDLERKAEGGTPQAAFLLTVAVQYQTIAGDPYTLGQA